MKPGGGGAVEGRAPGDGDNPEHSRALLSNAISPEGCVCVCQCVSVVCVIVCICMVCVCIFEEAHALGFAWVNFGMCVNALDHLFTVT